MKDWDTKMWFVQWKLDILILKNKWWEMQYGR